MNCIAGVLYGLKNFYSLAAVKEHLKRGVLVYLLSKQTSLIDTMFRPVVSVLLHEWLVLFCF